MGGILPSWFDSGGRGPGARMRSVNSRAAAWIVTALFGGLLILQIVRFGALQLPVHLPVVLLVATGLLAGLIPSLKSLQTRLMFVSAYGTAFIWMWATGQPNSGLGVGRFWLATTVLLLAIMAVLAYVQAQGEGKKWSWAFLLAVVFGLFIAFISGPEGGSDGMVKLVQMIFGYTDDDWRIVSRIVFFIRKTIHFTAYGSAAFFTAWAVWRQGGKLGSCWAAGYAWPLPLSVFDEWNQSHVNTRTGTMNDVVLDIFGMTFFLFVFTWFYKRRERKELEDRL